MPLIALNFTGAKQQLLYKLRRFEKLAELDPVELEKRMQDQEEDEDETFMEEEDGHDEKNQASCKENDFRKLIFQALCQSSVHDRQQRKGRSRGRGKGRGRVHCHQNNRVGTPSSNNTIFTDQVVAKQPPGPRMPDGTRGFSMGRGKPVAVNIA